MGNSALKTEIIEIEEGTDSFQIIRCPDNRPAQDILKRFSAEVIDCLIIGLIFFFSQILTLGFARLFVSPYINEEIISGDILNLIIFSSTYIFVKSSYYYVLYRQKCTTLGKKFFHFRIYRTNTQEPIGIIRIILREFIGKNVTLIFFPLSFLWYLIDSKSRLPHDIISGTMAVEELKEHNGIDY